MPLIMTPSCREYFLDLHPFREVQAEDPIRGDMTIYERSQRTQVFFLHLLKLLRFSKEGVHVHETDLQEVEREGCYFLLIQAIGGIWWSFPTLL